MTIGDVINSVTRHIGFEIIRTPTLRRLRNIPPTWYDRDGLITCHNHDFMDDPDFIRAYNRAVQAAQGQDFRFQWRVHVALWAAWCASRLEGDFVECGVSWGCVSSAIMESLDWDRLGKTFYLLDTFSGMDESLLTESEKASGFSEKNATYKATGGYALNIDTVRANFSQWKNVRIIQGIVPDTLAKIDSQKIVYLHLDMNCTVPEIAAVEGLWERIVPGGMILMDDFAFYSFDAQHEAFKEFARKHDQKILALPTGQGLMIR